VPVLIVGLLAAGFFFKGGQAPLDGILIWLAFNCGLAALGSLAALAHPLTILVTFVSAPLGTLNPFLSVGLFAGLAEAALRKPKVEDFERLSTDISSIKGFWKNRVTRVLLIFLLSSLGGMLGNFISAGNLIGRLF
jgi:pheromone shutdown protein TraB